MLEPRVGEEGIVVHFSPPDLYMVEKVLPNGQTLWLTEFEESELEVVPTSSTRAPASLEP
jgi:hypothetical protein